jgi:hypothetical protein
VHKRSGRRHTKHALLAVFVVFSRELSAIDVRILAEILGRRRLGEPKNSQVVAVLSLVSAVLVEESSVAKVALPPGNSFSAVNDDIHMSMTIS